MNHKDSQLCEHGTYRSLCPECSDLAARDEALSAGKVGNDE